MNLDFNWDHIVQRIIASLQEPDGWIGPALIAGLLVVLIVGLFFERVLPAIRYSWEAKRYQKKYPIIVSQTSEQSNHTPIEAYDPPKAPADAYVSQDQPGEAEAPKSKEKRHIPPTPKELWTAQDAENAFIVLRASNNDEATISDHIYRFYKEYEGLIRREDLQWADWYLREFYNHCLRKARAGEVEAYHILRQAREDEVWPLQDEEIPSDWNHLVQEFTSENVTE